MSSSFAPENVSKHVTTVGYFHLRLPSMTIENIRRHHSAFFAAEGLTEFVNLDWDIKVDTNLITEFLLNYDVKNRTVKIRGEEISIDDALMLEVFHLPRGVCKMPKKNKRTRLKCSPHFAEEEVGKGYILTSCNDNVWPGRLLFLDYFCILVTSEQVIPYNFVQFLQAEGTKRDWFDAFMFFFKAEIRRILKTNGSHMISTIGSHITLLLAHMEKKKRLQEVGPRQQRLTQGQLTPKETDRKHQKQESSIDTERRDEENEAEEEEEGESRQDQLEEEQTFPPSLYLRSSEQLQERMSELVNLVEWLKTDHGNRITAFRNENDSLRKEVEKWKNETKKWKAECGKVEEAREELQAKVTAFCTIVNGKFAKSLPEDNTSFEFATPASSRRTKVRKRPEAERA